MTSRRAGRKIGPRATCLAVCAVAAMLCAVALPLLPRTPSLLLISHRVLTANQFDQNAYCWLPGEKLMTARDHGLYLYDPTTGSQVEARRLQDTGYNIHSMSASPYGKWLSWIETPLPVQEGSINNTGLDRVVVSAKPLQGNSAFDVRSTIVSGGLSSNVWISDDRLFATLPTPGITTYYSTEPETGEMIEPGGKPRLRKASVPHGVRLSILEDIAPRSGRHFIVIDGGAIQVHILFDGEPELTTKPQSIRVSECLVDDEVRLARSNYRFAARKAVVPGANGADR